LIDRWRKDEARSRTATLVVHARRQSSSQIDVLKHTATATSITTKLYHRSEKVLSLLKYSVFIILFIHSQDNFSITCLRHELIGVT
jgi:hypothetical protein